MPLSAFLPCLIAAVTLTGQAEYRADPADVAQVDQAAKLRAGTVYDDQGTTRTRWVWERVPKGLAGTWQLKSGQLMTPGGLTPKVKATGPDLVLGTEIDKQGGIWNRYPIPHVVRVIADGRQTITIDVPIELDTDGEHIGHRLKHGYKITTNAQGVILDVRPADMDSSCVLDGDMLVNATRDITNGGASKTTYKRKAAFSPDNKKDQINDLAAYLRSIGRGDLAPD